jgi:dynactin complex subunit
MGVFSPHNGVSKIKDISFNFREFFTDESKKNVMTHNSKITALIQAKTYENIRIYFNYCGNIFCNVFIYVYRLSLADGLLQTSLHQNQYSKNTEIVFSILSCLEDNNACYLDITVSFQHMDAYLKKAARIFTTHQHTRGCIMFSFP